MAKYFIEDTTLTNIADAIRAKDGTTEPILTEDMASRIDAIASGGDTSIEDGIVEDTLTEYENNRVTNIAQYKFYNSKSLVSVDIQNVETIKAYAFYGCTNVENFNAPNVKILENRSLCGMSKLKKIILHVLEETEEASMGNNVALSVVDIHSACTFGARTFVNGLLDVVVLRSKEYCTFLTSDVFSGTRIARGIGYIYVPSDMVDTYKAMTNLTIYADQILPLEGSEYENPNWYESEV